MQPALTPSAMRSQYSLIRGLRNGSSAFTRNRSSCRAWLNTSWHCGRNRCARSGPLAPRHCSAVGRARCPCRHNVHPVVQVGLSATRGIGIKVAALRVRAFEYLPGAFRAVQGWLQRVTELPAYVNFEAARCPPGRRHENQAAAHKQRQPRPVPRPAWPATGQCAALAGFPAAAASRRDNRAHAWTVWICVSGLVSPISTECCKHNSSLRRYAQKWRTCHHKPCQVSGRYRYRV